MTAAQDKVMRFAADLVDSATVEGRRQSRSAKQQLDHWARVGRALSEQHTAARRRIEAALDGSLPLRDLNAAERTVVNAELDAATQELLLRSNWGQEFAAQGMTTVALDDDGNLVQYNPDGTSAVIERSIV
jgi:hypothetical protein